MFLFSASGLVSGAMGAVEAVGVQLRAVRLCLNKNQVKKIDSNWLFQILVLARLRQRVISHNGRIARRRKQTQYSQMTDGQVRNGPGNIRSVIDIGLIACEGAISHEPCKHKKVIFAR